jgi:alpha-L-rhamnosidase
VPNPHRTGLSWSPAAAWGDAATIVPWTIYQRTGDRDLLRRQFPSMRAWVDKLVSLAGPDRIWSGGFQYGDWLDPTAPPERPGEARADRDVIATAHFAHSAQLVSEAATVLGQTDVAEQYRAIAAEVRQAFADAFVTPKGRVLSDAQAVYALAIEWDLLPTDAQRVGAGRRLADLVRSSSFRIGTGFVGTPIICDALTRTGHVDIAYRLLLQTECPSWLYPVTMHATTIWERWDSLLPDGAVNPGGMTSFNHYALGAVADWLHRTVGGLAPVAPGYREVLIAPRLHARLNRAAARHESPYGEVAVAWERANGRVRLDLRIPVGVRARVRVPGAAADEEITVEHGQHRWEVDDPLLPTAEPRPLTIRDVIDDPGLWERVTAASSGAGVATDGDVGVARLLAGYLDEPASAIVAALASDEQAPEAERLRLDLEPLVATAPQSPDRSS